MTAAKQQKKIPKCPKVSHNVQPQVHTQQETVYGRLCAAFFKQYQSISKLNSKMRRSKPHLLNQCVVMCKLCVDAKCKGLCNYANIIFRYGLHIEINVAGIACKVLFTRIPKHSVALDDASQSLSQGLFPGHSFNYFKLQNPKVASRYRYTRRKLFMNFPSLRNDFKKDITRWHLCSVHVSSILMPPFPQAISAPIAD